MLQRRLKRLEQIAIMARYTSFVSTRTDSTARIQDTESVISDSISDDVFRVRNIGEDFHCNTHSPRSNTDTPKVMQFESPDGLCLDAGKNAFVVFKVINYFAGTVERMPWVDTRQILSLRYEDKRFNFVTTTTTEVQKPKRKSLTCVLLQRRTPQQISE